VVADTAIVPFVGGTITGSTCDSLPWWLPLCGIGFGFDVPSVPFRCTDFSVCLPDGTGPPTPGVAVRQDRNGRAAFLVVTDGIRDTVGYTVDPARGFQEQFRNHDTGDSNEAREPPSVSTSPPMITTEGHSVVALEEVNGRLIFAGPNPVALPEAPLGDLGGPTSQIAVEASLTQLADGRLVAVQRGGHQGQWSLPGQVGVFTRSAFQPPSLAVPPAALGGQSVASAAASCSYFYVGSTGAFTTFDNRTLRPVASVPWYGGGRVPPAIGPGGQVYAIASTAMFIFPPARAVTVGGTGCGPGEILGEP
jgi:hypothetical protein